MDLPLHEVNTTHSTGSSEKIREKQISLQILQQSFV